MHTHSTIYRFNTKAIIARRSEVRVNPVASEVEGAEVVVEVVDVVVGDVVGASDVDLVSSGLGVVVVATVVGDGEG